MCRANSMSCACGVSVMRKQQKVQYHPVDRKGPSSGWRTYEFRQTTTVMSCQSDFNPVVHIKPLRVVVHLQPTGAVRHKICITQNPHSTHNVCHACCFAHEIPSSCKVLKNKCLFDGIASINGFPTVYSGEHLLALISSQFHGQVAGAHATSQAGPGSSGTAQAKSQSHFCYNIIVNASTWCAVCDFGLGSCKQCKFPHKVPLLVPPSSFKYHSCI